MSNQPEFQSQSPSGGPPSRRGLPERRSPRRRKSAPERRKDRLRIAYIIVAVAMVLLLLAGVFAPVGPTGVGP